MEENRKARFPPSGIECFWAVRIGCFWNVVTVVCYWTGPAIRQIGASETTGSHHNCVEIVCIEKTKHPSECNAMD